MRLLFLALLLPVALCRKPVILVPGLMGSSLEFNIENHDGLPSVCKVIGSKEWHRGWISVWEVAILESCYDHLTKIYCSHSSVDKFGLPLCGPSMHTVQWRAESYGSLDAIDYLYKTYLHDFPYFHTMSSRLENELGYVVGKSLFGHSYDWRLAPASFAQPNVAYSDRGSDFQRLRNLVEHAYELNREPVVLISHSLGTVVVTSFLRQMTASWKEEYVHHSLMLAPAYGGSTDASAVLTVGESNLGLPVQDIEQRLFGSYPSMSALSMLPEWTGGDHPFVTTKDGRTFTLDSLQDLIREVSGVDIAINFPVFQEWLRRQLTLPTMVSTSVVVGTGHETTGSIMIEKDDLGVWHSDVTSFIDGDGTVPYVSARGASDKLRAAEAAAGNDAFEVFECEMGHRDVICDPKTVQKCSWSRVLEAVN